MNPINPLLRKKDSEIEALEREVLERAKTVKLKPIEKKKKIVKCIKEGIERIDEKDGKPEDR